MNMRGELKEKMMKESEYPLTQVYFYLTEGCNLACRHCWLNPKLQDERNVYKALPIELFQSILEQAKPLGLKAVKLTGGEPLMHPEINEILKILKEHNISISVETNGVLCTSSLAAAIAGVCKKPSVSVSLDGADAKIHEWVRNIKGCFEDTLQGIRNLVDAGVKPQIIMMVMKHNKDQLEAVVRLAESLGAGSVKFNLVQPTGRGERMDKEGGTVPLQELVELGHWVFNTLSRSSKLKLFYDIPAAFRPMSKMFGEQGIGCARCAINNIMGVLANGDYALCGIGSQVPELVFGNAAAEPLNVIWKTNKIILELRNGIPDRFEGICGKCHMKRVCSASCIAQNYYQSKSLWKPYWFCDQAYNEGLYPETRVVPQTLN